VLAESVERHLPKVSPSPFSLSLGSITDLYVLMRTQFRSFLGRLRFGCGSPVPLAAIAAYVLGGFSCGLFSICALKALTSS
jgi:hypothetical protein